MKKKILSLATVVILMFSLFPMFAVSVVAASVPRGQRVFSPGFSTSGIIDNDGGLWTWGWGYRGGEPTTPVREMDNVVHIQVAEGNIFALAPDGVLWYVLRTVIRPDGTQFGGGTRTQIMDNVAYFYAPSRWKPQFAILNDGSLWGWGNNYHGELGAGLDSFFELWSLNCFLRDDYRLSPVWIMDNVVNVKTASARREGVPEGEVRTGNSTFAIQENGQLWAWGCNYHGQLGDGTRTDRNSPVLVMESVIDVISNEGSTFAIRADGSLWAWGRNHHGQLGDGTTTNRTLPVWIVDNVSHVVSSGWAGMPFTFAVRSDNTLWGWGWNSRGNLGDGSETVSSRIQTSPIRILDDVTYVSSVAGQTFAIRTDGSMWAWGTSYHGGIGDGGTESFHSHYRPIWIMDSVVHVVRTPYEETFAICDKGSLWAWGGSPHAHNSLGLGIEGIVNRPTRVMDNVRLPGTIIHPPLQFSDENGVTMIRTAACLAAMSGAQSAGRTFVLANDITVSEPIVDFRGTFDGAGNVITFTMRDDRRLFATAGLFESINEGTVAIGNLGVETRGGQISAFALSGDNSRAFAGGLIGVVSGGDVTIENVYFHGNVHATSHFDRKLSNANRVLTNVSNFLLDELRDAARSAARDAAIDSGLLPDWFWIKEASTIRTVLGVIFDAFWDNGSRAYAGGLIGFIGGDANVRIVNSHARGNVRAQAGLSIFELSSYFGTARAYANAGGMVGMRAGNSRLTIENSYVFNAVEASAATCLFTVPNSNAGALVGSGGVTNPLGSVFRLDAQTLTVNRVGLAFRRYGSTNTNGITRSLTQTEMRDRNSFPGWDFDNVWAISPSRNNGYPHLQVFAQAFVPEFLRPLAVFADGFSNIRGSNAPLTLTVDMPVSSFVSVQVNNMYLTQNEHFTLQSGSTQVTLLPAFLDTLEYGFHTLTVNFEDGVFAEEQFLIVDSDEMEVFAERLYSYV